MKDKYLVINCGSSSVKFQLFELPEQKVIAKGTVERIGKENCEWTIKAGDLVIKDTHELKSHVEAVKVILDTLLKNEIVKDLKEIKGIGHRVLHGGTLYKDSAIIDEKVLQDIIDLTPLGPLHHPGEIEGILCMQKLLPGVPNVAVFDTAFHQSIPRKNYEYPIPEEWRAKGARSYGFHGTSVKFITEYMQKKLKKKNVNLIVCHIGSGASITAVKWGKSYVTTMGLTPLDGLMMGTRSGSIDPSLLEFMQRVTGKSLAELLDDLNTKSGLYGISGKNDYRDIEKAASEGDENAQLALEMFTSRVVDTISKFYTQLDGHVDGIIFTAGIGENAYKFRESVINELPLFMDCRLDEKINENIASFKVQQEGMISEKNARCKAYVVPTDEEKMIMLDTYRLVNGASKLDEENLSFDEIDKRSKVEKEKYELSLIAFYLQNYMSLYTEVINDMENYHEVDIREIFNEMLSRNQELWLDYTEDISALGYSDYNDILENRLNIIREREAKEAKSGKSL